MTDPPADVREVTTDVAVIGAGPCGITMANLLAVYGVRAVVIDAQPGIYEYPRAVGIDDESLRTFQAIAVVGRLLEDIVQNTPIRYYTSWGRLMAHVEPSVRPFGWPRRNNFLQPLFEAALREKLTESDSVELWLGARLAGYEQDDDGVTADIEDSDGNTVRLRAKYLVGTDGGRSTVRKIAGIEMTGATAPSKWLVVDVADDELDAPYSAVYCDPVRPVLMIPLPYGHRRWEFKLNDADDEAALTDPQRVLTELIAPRYGAAPLPRVLRSAVYLHHSRTAERFRAGRVFLAGDAAHLQPPFFGQGMNSGIRDATNLAWKLALVLQGSAGDGLLDTYDSERREHAATMVNFATRMGQMYSPHNLATERVRAAAFRGVQKIPGARDYILQMKYKPMPRYTRGAVVPYAGTSPGRPARADVHPAGGGERRRRPGPARRRPRVLVRPTRPARRPGVRPQRGGGAVVALARRALRPGARAARGAGPRPGRQAQAPRPAGRRLVRHRRGRRRCLQGLAAQAARGQRHRAAPRPLRGRRLLARRP